MIFVKNKYDLYSTLIFAWKRQKIKMCNHHEHIWTFAEHEFYRAKHP